MSDNWLLTLDQINADALALVGAKSLNLAALTQNHLASPPGLVVTTTFFEAQINHYAYQPIWAGSPDVAVTEGALEFLADFLKTKPLAPQLEAALQARLKTVFPPEIESFAVRSSAVDEDQSDYSFAGCYLSELAVPRDLITVSLTRCWASALTGRVIKYRLKHSLPLQSIKVAVLIQPMLKPQVAGVAFTLNPVTGSRDELVIEAANQLGEAVVSGRIQPYRYHLDRNTTPYRVQQKAPDATRFVRPPLSNKQLTTLAETLEKIEALMGAPQDVEWAYQDDTFYFLQTRPISTNHISTSPNSSDSGIKVKPTFDTEWTRANHPEVLPELPSPLFVSLMERTQGRGVKFFSKIGLDVSGVGPYIKSFYGRPYLNLSIIKRVLTQLGLRPIPLLAMAGYIQTESISDPFDINLTTLWHAKKQYLQLVKEIFKLGATVNAYQALTNQIIRRLEKTHTNPAGALSQFKLREQVYGELIGVGLVLVSALTGLMVLVARLITPLTESSTTAFGVLGTLGKDPGAVNHNVMLWNLSQMAMNEPVVQAYLINSEQSLTDYQTVLAGTAFLTAFETYLKKNGFRATYEPDMGWPRFKEQPEVLLQTVSQYLRLIDKTPDKLSMEKAPVGAQQSFWEIWRSLTAHAKGIHRIFPWRQVVALPLMALLTKGFALRGDMRVAEARAMAAVRRWDLALAQKWVRANYLAEVDDYFWLKTEEIERALATEKDAGIHLKPAVRARKAAYQVYEQMNVAFVMKESEMTGFNHNNPQSVLDGTLVGLSVSPGQIQGEVRFLQDFKNFEDVPKGCILVVPSTDPVYLPFFPLASGLIVERGGMLSHGSIIAREYGLPAVSNIVDARRSLAAGDRVLLDGSTGLVQILERAA